MEYGNQIGKPIILLHGINHSRLMFSIIPGFPFRDDLHLIVPDRPGYGMSDPFPNSYSVVDYPKDIVELAESLGLDKFSMFGFSGGAPYTLACAWQIPERVSNAGIFGGIGPLNQESRKGIILGLRALYWLSYRTPFLARFFMNTMPLLVNRNYKFYTRLLYSRLTENERVAHMSLTSNLVKLDRIEGFRQGNRASTYDLSLALNWPIPLEEINSKISIWQGEEDRYTGNMGRYIGKIIPNCSVTIIPDQGHYWIFEHLEEMLLALINNQ